MRPPSSITPAKSPNPISHIIITGAREHNLQNLNLAIPKNQLVVLTGLSGSGKSSLAFDTLYAEGQRRYVESLSSYARQFLGLMSKPDVDAIEGLAPAISIDQKTTSHNPRSTVGTITEIYDYLRLLYARIGHPHCAQCGREISTQTLDQIVNHVCDELTLQAGSVPVRLMLLAPVVRDHKGEFGALFENLRKKGYSRIRIDQTIFDLGQDFTLIKTNKHRIEVVIDRLTISRTQLQDPSEAKILRSRLAQSIEESLRLADGFVIASFIQDQSLNFPDQPQQFIDRLFSEKLACSYCGISITDLEPRLFSFNSPQGACLICHGLGSILKIDINKILAPSLTLSEGAIVPFARMMSHETWWGRLVKKVVEIAGYDFRKTAFQDINSETQQLLLFGSDLVYTVVGENRFGRTTSIEQQFEGFVTNLERRYEETDSEFMRQEIGQYMQRETCGSCQGARLQPAALSVHINRQHIAQVTSWPIDQTLDWISRLPTNSVLTDKERQIADSILKEIGIRLRFLVSVGLSYLSLDREAATLAGGEAQRIRLASQIGTGLTGVLYILDEPTVGLHQRDNHQLINTLKSLRDKGNSVVVVEHDRDVILAADYVIDFGPGAGRQGGQIIAAGSPQHLSQQKPSLTGKYLSRRLEVSRPVSSDTTQPRLVAFDQQPTVSAAGLSIQIRGATHHNLKQIDVDFPLGKLICITGVSGSGKSTLLYETLYAHLTKHLGKKTEDKPGPIDRIMVPDSIKKTVLIDQSPIGKTPRSNPATYTKIFDYIRQLFENTTEAKMRGYRAGRFSFNVKGGRCEACQGDGQIKIEMQFLPDVYVTCDVCHGSRYNQETLEVNYRSKNISDILHLTVNEARDFFRSHPTLGQKLQTLIDVGLGYIELGQPAPTLSGGEAQRVKLAKELSGRTHDHVVYLLDEPTTGLHFADVQKLLNVLHQLVAHNNTVIVIEHNLDIIKNADWIIDLGPEGGETGGMVIATGSPHQISHHSQSHTGRYLALELSAHAHNQKQLVDNH